MIRTRYEEMLYIHSSYFLQNPHKQTENNSEHTYTATAVHFATIYLPIVLTMIMGGDRGVWVGMNIVIWFPLYNWASLVGGTPGKNKLPVKRMPCVL